VTAQVFGTWAFVVLGIIVVLAGIVRMFLKEPRVQLILMCFVFGVLMSGVGVYGMGFLDKYGQFLDTTKLLTSMLEAPSDKTYASTSAAIASGKMDPAVSQVALAYMTARPTEGYKSILANAEKRSVNPKIAGEFSAARTDVERKEAAATELTQSLSAKNELNSEKLQSLDASTKIYVARTLITSPQVAPQHEMSPAVIKQLATPQAKQISSMKTLKPVQP
jgi:hypothetical protein